MMNKRARISTIPTTRGEAPVLDGVRKSVASL